MASAKIFKSDVLIIGSGAAGLSAALRLADNHHVSILCKQNLPKGSTYYAQGGIAAVLAGDDSLESHVNDTLVAGADLCDLSAVQFTISQAPEMIRWLTEKGVCFSKDCDADDTLGATDYHLNREGGHSHRRIVHSDDATGKAVETTLIDLVKAHPNIQIFEHRIAVDLIVNDTGCIGCYVFDSQKKVTDSFVAKATLLATGGASRTYLYTSNPWVSSGDGMAIAWRAGCRLANMEFNQFHPTCLYHPQAGASLISEALRGEGAVLRLPDGSRFMHRFDERAELAPRDCVARAIDYEMKRLGLECVYLDISHKPAEFIKKHFPNIYTTCIKFGFDITQNPVPVVPAAHYTCGGVMINERAQTDISGLYAAGEVSYTGLHGANRMASNSLLECLVYGAAAATDINDYVSTRTIEKTVPLWDKNQVVDADEEIMVPQNWAEIRHFMWNYVGIVRSNKRLERAQRRIDILKDEIQDYYGNFHLTGNLIELRNLALIAELIIQSACQRQESRGLHYTLDYPDTKPEWRHPTILTPTHCKQI